MRDYSKVSASFWTGVTGKSMRGDAAAQIVCLYLMTSPHANMIGVYQCPILYIAHETGLTIEGASKGLQRAIEGGFCTYDEASEVVFVHAFARYQLLDGAGDSLKAGDKRVVAVLKAASNIPSASIRAAFVAEYASAIPGLEALKPKGLGRGIEAPPKPETGTGTGTEEKPPYPPTGAGEAEVSPKSEANGIAEITADETLPANVTRIEPVCRIVLDAYHRHLPNCLPAHTLTPKRQRRILTANKLAKTLIAQKGLGIGVAEFWDGYFAECAGDEWLRGDTPNPKNPRWRQNIDVLLAEDRFGSIMDAALARDLGSAA